MREALEGRGWARIIGSMSLLAQRLGFLNGLFKENASLAKITAEAYADVAVKASQNAVALAKKAAASAAAFTEDASDSAASLEQAVADEAAAVAANEHAAAMMRKAEAAQAAAASETEEAAASVGSLGIVTGILIALTAGAYAAYKQVNYLLDRMTGFKPPDFKPEYIAQHLQKANQGLEVEKQITSEIQKQIDLYNSAAKSADRVADAKALADLEEFKSKGNAAGISKDQLFKAYNSLTDSGVSTSDLDAADKKLRSDRHGYEKSYRESVDRSAANDETRAQGGESFAKQSAKAFADAAAIGQQLPDMKNNAAQANADEAEESLAESNKPKHIGGRQLTQTEWEKAGVGMGPSVMVDTGKQQVDLLKQIANNTKNKGRK